MPRIKKVEAERRRIVDSQVGRETRTFKGRVYVEIDIDEADENDVLQYIEPGFPHRSSRGFRTNVVSGRRGGADAAVRVRLHDCDGGGNRWIPMVECRSAWRWRGAFA